MIPETTLWNCHEFSITQYKWKCLDIVRATALSRQWRNDSHTIRNRSPGDEEMEAAKTDEKSLAAEETPLSDSKIL